MSELTTSEVEKRREKISPLQLMEALSVVRFSRICDFASSIKIAQEPQCCDAVCISPVFYAATNPDKLSDPGYTTVTTIVLGGDDFVGSSVSGPDRALEVAMPEGRGLGAGPADRPHRLADFLAVPEQDAGRGEGYRVAAREGFRGPIDVYVVQRLQRLGPKGLGE